MIVLRIEINCGVTTCASEKGKFCQYLGTKSFGTQSVCMLFPDDTSYTKLESVDGWVRRCDKCLAVAELVEPDDEV